MKRVPAYLVSVLLLSACAAGHYSRQQVQSAGQATVLYQWPGLQAKLAQPLSISLAGSKAGEVIEEYRLLESAAGTGARQAYSREVVFSDSRTGQRRVLWTYSNFAWLMKLTQGPEQGMVRLYHGLARDTTRYFVTELDIENARVRQYLLHRDDFERLAK